MVIDWGSILQAVLIAALPPLVAAIVRYLWARAAEVWQDLENSKPELAWVLREAARFGVQAAEQMGISGQIEDKKQFAIQYAEKWLQTQGVEIDLDLVDAAIEAAVIELFPKEIEKAN